MRGHTDLAPVASNFTHLEEAHDMRKWTLIAVLLLAGCSSDQDPSAPSPVTPSPTPAPTPAAPSPYAGNWVFRTTLLAVDVNCGHTPSDIGTAEGPLAVAVASNGTFTLPSGNQGAIDSAGNVSFTLAPVGGTCSNGTGAGGCRDHDHCDGTSQQSGDVKKWTLFRQ
jgi:hypothetical protein